MVSSRKKGFTLAELLISVAILGVIATFTIPKIMVTQQSEAYNAKTRETMGMISAAFQQAKLNGLVSSNTGPGVITPYINYVSIDTASTIDGWPVIAPTQSCTAGTPCLRLANGGILQYSPTTIFGGTTTMHFIGWTFDPDFGNSSPGSGVALELYYDGMITTRGQIKINSCWQFGCGIMPSSTYDPSWLKI